MENIKLRYHAYYWLFDFTYQCVILLFIAGTNNFNLDLPIIFTNLLSRVGFFYILLIFILPKYYNQQKYLSAITLLLLSAFSLAFLDGKISKAMALNISSFIDGLSSFQVSVDNFFDLIIVIFPTAFAFYYIDQNIAIAEEQRAIEHQNNLLEQSIIKEKLSGLRMQINPAFLERTLAYFYRESLPYSPNLSKGITLLSDMMKYALNEDDKEGKVPLENEIKHIRNFIEIQQLRFDNRLQVNFEVSGEIQNKPIMPLLLITFIENSFKYGELHDAKHSLSIKLSVVDDRLFFRTHNWKRRGPKEESEGIGIVNTQRRLTLAYPNKHHLSIHDNLDDYEVDLSLTLS